MNNNENNYPEVIIENKYNFTCMDQNLHAHAH